MEKIETKDIVRIKKKKVVDALNKLNKNYDSSYCLPYIPIIVIPSRRKDIMNDFEKMGKAEWESGYHQALTDLIEFARPCKNCEEFIDRARIMNSPIISNLSTDCPSCKFRGIEFNGCGDWYCHNCLKFGRIRRKIK